MIVLNRKMPTRLEAVDFVCTTSVSGRFSSQIDSLDLSASADGSTAYLLEYRGLYKAFMEAIDVDTGVSRRLTLNEQQFGWPRGVPLYMLAQGALDVSACFVFVLDAQTVAMVLTASFGQQLGVFTVSIDPNEGLVHRRRLVGQMLDVGEQYINVIACQYRHSVFVACVLDPGLVVKLGHYDVARMSMRRLDFTSPRRLKDAVAYNGKLHFTTVVQKTSDDDQTMDQDYDDSYPCDPKTIVTYDFTTNVGKVETATTHPDPLHGYPPEAEMSLDMCQGKLWAYIESDGSFWTLALNSLTWTKQGISLDSRFIESGSCLLALSTGAMFVLAECTDEGCPKPCRYGGRHLFKFWTDVPSLEQLAFSALRKSLLNNGSNVTVDQLIASGVPNVHALNLVRR